MIDSDGSDRWVGGHCEGGQASVGRGHGQSSTGRGEDSVGGSGSQGSIVDTPPRGSSVGGSTCKMEIYHTLP